MYKKRRKDNVVVQQQMQWALGGQCGRFLRYNSRARHYVLFTEPTMNKFIG